MVSGYHIAKFFFFFISLPLDLQKGFFCCMSSSIPWLPPTFCSISSTLLPWPGQLVIANFHLFLFFPEIHVLISLFFCLCSFVFQAAFFEDKSRPAETLIRLERMMNYDTFFKELAMSPVFNGLVDCLLSVPCEPNNVQFFSKPPGSEGNTSTSGAECVFLFCACRS